MAVITTYDDGNRLEDVMMVVTVITPTKTPFMSSIRKAHASNSTHQWPEDTLTVRSDNAVVEGGAFAYGTITAPIRSSNLTQIFQKTFQVSSAERWVKGAGVTDQYLYQKAKKTKEIATDIETALLLGTLNAGSIAAARRLAGAIAFSTTNSTTVSSGVLLTETLFNGQMQLNWVSGGEPDEVYVNALLKRAIDGFNSTAKPMFTDATDKGLVAQINTYDGSFGKVSIYKSLDIPNGTNSCGLLMIENEKFAMAIGEPVHELPEDEVAQTVNGTSGVIRGELTLEDKSQAASSYVYGYNNI